MTTTPILLTNTLTGRKEALRTHSEGTVSVYGCGPTVYGLTHVGNARTALAFDLVHRILKLAGYKVLFLRNITDIDDKIINVAKDRGLPWTAIAQEFTQTFQNEMRQLGNLPLTLEPKATEHIPEIIQIIEGLIQKNLAYAAETPFGNDVYFAVERFAPYGKLSKRKLEDMRVGARIEPGESKNNPMDFALWKAAKTGEPSWSSPWGEGRPGWHIECSAMIFKQFPKGIDIHMGGLDLIFPHHENEIAQSEGFCGCELANHWMHGGMLVLGKEKMSKSLGNIFTTQKFLDQYGAETLRLMCAQHHYRSPMEFSEESVQKAEALLERLYLAKAELSKAGAKANPLSAIVESMKAAMFDDFNTAKALGFALKAVREGFKTPGADSWTDFASCLPLLADATHLLTDDPFAARQSIRDRRLKRLGITHQRCSEIEALLSSREEARKNKDYALSDKLRAELEAQGIVVMDGADGAAWTLKGT